MQVQFAQSKNSEAAGPVDSVLVDNETSNPSTSTASIEQEHSETNTSPPSTEDAVSNLAVPNLAERHVGLKTSTANSIKRLIDHDNDLVKFDEIRFKMKQSKQEGSHVSRADRLLYKQIVKKIEMKVKLVQSKRDAQLKELERIELQHSGDLPAKTPGSRYYNILKQRNLAINILRSL